MNSDGPKKLYYSISEVSEMTGIKPHILRFWEKDFTTLRPRKNRAGNRSYRERDIQIVLAIKRLLYEEKYTIKGARDRLRRDRSLVDEIEIETGLGEENGPQARSAVPTEAVPCSGTDPEPSSPVPSQDADQVQSILDDIRRDLTDLLQIIDGK